MNDLVQWILGGATALLSAAVGVVWKKADQATPKDDFKEFARDTRDTMKVLFANAEADRKQLHDCVDRIEAEIHKIHVEFLKERRN